MRSSKGVFSLSSSTPITGSGLGGFIQLVMNSTTTAEVIRVWLRSSTTAGVLIRCSRYPTPLTVNAPVSSAARLTGWSSSLVRDSATGSGFDTAVNSSAGYDVATVMHNGTWTMTFLPEERPVVPPGTAFLFWTELTNSVGASTVVADPTYGITWEEFG